ncbi:MAG: hypothetical protein QOJ40_185 [Verrucomicrobiota bacterium]
MSEIRLRRVATGEAVAASLCDEITDGHLEMWAGTWQPAMEAFGEGMPAEEVPEDSEWNWIANARIWRRFAKYQSFAIICDGGLQGLMVTNNILRARLSIPVGKPIVYVELLATAPWNRAEIQTPPRYRGTGWALMLAAVELSREMEFRGRIGLHSLPGAEPFYRFKCRMTDLGMDQEKGLAYFEMNEEQAEAFRQKTTKL